jgi:hypothetical protein
VRRDARLLARESLVVTLCAAGAYTAHELLARERGTPLWLRMLPWVLGGSYAAFHVVAGTERRWTGMARRNAQRKAGLQAQWALLAARIDIMRALSTLPAPAAMPAVAAAAGEMQQEKAGAVRAAPPPPQPATPAHVTVRLGTPAELAAAAAARQEAERLPKDAPSPRGPEAV